MNHYISAFGLISSVGHDVTTGCAALRAGLSRPVELNFPALDEDMMPTKVIGHPIDGITNGYYFIGRWLRLAEHALVDLVYNIGLVGDDLVSFWENTGMIVIIPDTIDRYLVTAPIDDEYIVTQYVQKLLTSINLKIDLVNIKVIREGHTGTAAALKYSDESFETNAINKFLVVAVDSYAEVTTLSWLDKHNRLKVADQPTGIIPGEAAVCYLISRENLLPSDNRARSGLKILGVELGVDSDFENLTSTNPGRVLANTIEKLLKNLLVPLPFVGDIYVDLNGEKWRSAEFGVAISILQKEVFSSNVNVISTCPEIGETGVANSSIALCLAAHGYERRYSHNNVALIISQSEDGVVGAICVDKI